MVVVKVVSKIEVTILYKLYTKILQPSVEKLAFEQVSDEHKLYVCEIVVHAFHAT